MRNQVLFPAIVMATLVTAASPSVAQQDKPETDAMEEATTEKQTQQPAPARVQEFVFVEGALPYVPQSNTVITKLPVELRLTPANVGTVTKPLFDEQYGQTVSGALNNVSNVNTQPGLGIFDFFLLRGFDSLSSSLVMTDGASEPEVSFYQLYNVELVEVYKGPGGYLYGSNPLAGVINLVRKQPVPGKFVDFGGTFGSYEHAEGRLDVNYGSPDGVASFRLNSLYRDANSYRDDKQGRYGAINPAVTFRLGEASKLNFNFEYADADYVPDSGIPLVGDQVAPVARETNYQSPLDTSQQEILRFQIDFQTQLNDVVLLRNKFYVRSLDWISSGTLYNGVFPSFATGQLEVSRTFIVLDDRQNFTGNQFEAVFTFDTGSVRHSLLSGVEIARFGDVFTLDPSLISSVDLLNPVDPGPDFRVPLVDFSTSADARSLVLAPYFIDQMQLSEKLHVLAGGRLDRIDFREDISGSERDDTEFSPMVGVVVAPRTDLSIYGNFSRAFAPPSARVVGDAVPEESTQVEFGVKKLFAPWNASTTFAVYQLERENIAIPDDNGFTQQVGNQRSRGFELELSAQPDPSLRTFVAYAYNDSELTNFTELVQLPVFPPAFELVDRSGNRPTFAPEHILNFWVSKDLPRGFGVGGGGRYVSEQFIAEDNQFAIDGVLTFDATAFYRFRDLLFRVNLKNLTDRQYFARGFGSNAVVPAPPFTAFFGVDVSL